MEPSEVEVASAVFTIAMSALGVPSFGVMTIATLELLFEGFGSVVEEFSPTFAEFVIVVPAVPAFTVATIIRAAVELADMSPMVHAPVEVT